MHKCLLTQQDTISIRNPWDISEQLIIDELTEVGNTIRNRVEMVSSQIFSLVNIYLQHILNMYIFYLSLIEINVHGFLTFQKELYGYVLNNNL